MKKIMAITVLCVLSGEFAFAQMIRTVSLKQQVENSSLVVEGKVIAKQSFWDAKHHNIYTANTIQVLKVFKGELVSNIEVVTLGGTVGMESLIVSPSLKLQKGDVGVFTLKANSGISNLGKSVNKQYKPYASLQSFYKYNQYRNTVVNPISKTSMGKVSFYNEITQYTKIDYTEVSALKNSNNNTAGKVLLPPSDITFSPTTASAGTKTVLTINGSGFGSAKGNVGFSNADDGGATFALALETQILTWSDTQITVEIPSEAGTGPILVQDSNSDNAQSEGSLTITYAESNAIFDPDDESQSGGGNGPLGPYAYPVRHVSVNGSGGLTWEMQTDFFNDTEFPGAKMAFERALDQWRCETRINWDVSGSATNVDVFANDGTNVVKFDSADIPSDDLDDGVLGQCFTMIRGCGVIGEPDTWNAHVTELDIVFDDETNWFFGEGLPPFEAYDFESVALHELGHGHQLGHVIDVVADGDNLDDVMHYAISNGEQQRVFLANNITAANNVQSRSTSVITCEQPVMINSSVCNLNVDEDELRQGISLFPNPVYGELHIANEARINLKEIRIYDLGGRLISNIDISDNTSDEKTISLAGVSKGVYFVNIHSDDIVITKKIIVK